MREGRRERGHQAGTHDSPVIPSHRAGARAINAQTHRSTQGRRQMRYDPHVAPDAEEWLQSDEDERLLAVLAYHERAVVELPDATVHAVFHVVIENQIASGEEAVVRAMARLQGKGEDLERHEAIHAIGSVLAHHLWSLQRTPSETVDADVHRTYLRNVERLTAEGWRKSFE